MSEPLRVAHLPTELRPREKLLAQGPAALSDLELLAIVLRTGHKGLGVFVLAQEVLTRFEGFAGLMQASAQDLRSCKGLGGTAKRAELLAVLEIARRALSQQLRERPVLQSPAAVKQYLQLELAALTHEVFAVLFLNAQHRLLSYQPMFRGSLAQTSVHPREIAKTALTLNAASVVLAHNHPSGQVQPSSADLQLTASLKSSLSLIDVTVLDHIIVAQGRCLSMAEEGLL